MKMRSFNLWNYLYNHHAVFENDRVAYEADFKLNFNSER